MMVYGSMACIQYVVSLGAIEHEWRRGDDGLGCWSNLVPPCALWVNWHNTFSLDIVRSNRACGVKKEDGIVQGWKV